MDKEQRVREGRQRASDAMLRGEPMTVGDCIFVRGGIVSRDTFRKWVPVATDADEYGSNDGSHWNV